MATIICYIIGNNFLGSQRRYQDGINTIDDIPVSAIDLSVPLHVPGKQGKQLMTGNNYISTI